MPMSPHKGESQSDFMGRCVPDLMGDGKREQDQAVAACLSIWRDAKGKATAAAITPPKKDESLADFMARCVPEVMAADPNTTAERAQTQCSVTYEEYQVPGNPTGIRAEEVKHKTHAEDVQGMEFVLSDETPDRMGDVIMANGWELKDFQKNPIALFNHKADWPIGTWKNLRVENSSLRGSLKLAPEGTSPRIDEIRRLIDAGVLKAVSVGFRSIASEPRKSPDAKWLGETFTKTELVETSLVSVPANPNALAIAKAMQISPTTIDMVFAKTGSADLVTTLKRAAGKPANTISPVRSVPKMTGLLTPRIEASEARLNGFRDQLTEHLKNLNDENVSDTDLATTSELNAKITQEEKTRESLIEAQSRLAKTSLTPEQVETQQRETGSDTRLTVYNPRPFALPAKKVNALDYLWRTLCVKVKHHNEHGQRPIQDIIKETYGEDEPTKAMVNYLARAASAPATIPQAGWAAELVTQVWMDFLQALIPFSVFPGVSAKGSSYTFGRNGVINLPLRNNAPSLAGSFVGEGAPIPVRQGGFATAQLTPKKMAVISTFTREIAEHSTPAIEGIIRESIMMDTGVAIDTVLLDANPATAVRPPGLLNGVTGIPPSTAGASTVAALNGDLKLLINALNTATLGNIRDPVWLMTPQNAVAASLAMTTTGDTPYRDEISRGMLLTYPIIKSTVVPTNTLILMDAADYASVTEAAPRFDVSDQAVLHMEDTTPLAISSPGTPPTVAAPSRSLWQTDTIGVRMILPMNWLLRRTGMVQFMTGMTWV